MSNQDNNCPNCRSSKNIKFGKTKSGSPRYKCKDCSKTWTVSGKMNYKPPMHYIAGLYFNGCSIRELVPIYKSSPHRINTKIREFLNDTPHWEVFLDHKFPILNSELIYLTGQNFSCNCEHDDCNNNYLAMAVDAQSSLILGYEISISNEDKIWDRLFKRMSERGIKCQRFLSKGNPRVTKAIDNYYPESNQQISVLRTLRNKEISCCLDNNPKNANLIEDIEDIYSNFEDRSLELLSDLNFGMSFKKFLEHNSDEFFTKLRERCGTKTTKKIENLADNFKERFERFHMIKCEPYPLVNGWVSFNMLDLNQNGFNRLMLFNKNYDPDSFASFTDEKSTENAIFDPKAFLIESAIRILQLPLNRVSIKNITKKEILSFA